MFDGFPAGTFRHRDSKPTLNLVKRKDSIGIGQLDPNSIESPDFVKDTAQAFKAAIPFVRFLCGALNLPL